MPFYVYILYSAHADKYYIGQTDSLERRLQEHNTRKNLGSNYWVICYSEVFESRADAMNREKEIKKKKRRSYIEWLIQQNG